VPGEIAWVIKNLERALPSELSRTHACDGDGKKAPRAVEAEEREWRTDPSDGLRPLLATRRRLVKEVAA
jgi:N-acetylneuraminate synthase